MFPHIIYKVVFYCSVECNQSCQHTFYGIKQYSIAYLYSIHRVGTLRMILKSTSLLICTSCIHTSQAKMRVLTLLGSDLELAERKLYVEGQNAAYSYLEAEWPNMKHVIMMDNQCTEACYEAYLKVKLMLCSPSHVSGR